MWEIKESNIEGHGVFATQTIKKGWIIGQAYDIMPGNVNGLLIAGEITMLGAMHNHSFEPNAKPEIYLNQVFFEALKTINKEAVENEITMTEIMFIILITDFSFLEKKYFKAK